MESRPHYILAGRFIDGSGDAIKEKMLLKIENGTFTAIESYNSSDTPEPSSLTDLSHCVVLPALLDSHVHLCMSGTIDPVARKKQLTAKPEQLMGVITEHISQQFAHGVVVLRDAGDKHRCVLRYRDQQIGRGREPVVVVNGGSAFHQKGRYGGLIGTHPGAGETLAEAFTREERPGDQIKIVNSGLNSLSVFGLETSSQFSVRELQELVARAKEQGKKVMVHANGRQPVQRALEAGCDSIEHGFFMGSANLEKMAENRTFWVPTIYTMKACALYADSCAVAADRRVIEKNLSHQIEQLSQARSCGVQVALGTDAGSIGVLHGEALVEELKLFMQAGYSFAEAISCATENNAKLLGLESEFGRIAVGKPAHFLVARGTPAQLPRKLLYLEALYLNGSPSTFYRKFRREMPDHKV
jgi:imidazolonepropionase-like amidohydrolase